MTTQFLPYHVAAAITFKLYCVNVHLLHFTANKAKIAENLSTSHHIYHLLVQSGH